MELELSDKIVVATGASKGIGYACGEAFAREGARVVLVSRSAKNLDAALARFPGTKHRPRIFVADLVHADESERMAEAVERDVGPIDIVVNSAGAARRYAPSDLNADAWHAAMDAKYFSYIHPIDAVLRRMAPRGRGAIVNIIGAGGKVASPLHLPGGAANAALMLATAGLAAAFAAKGIRVNGINPDGVVRGSGIFAGGWGAQRAAVYGVPEEELGAFYARRTLLKREVLPEHVAAAVFVLTAGELSLTTGVHIPVDAGVAAAFLR